MPGRQSLRLVPTRHHHFGGFDGLVLPVSVHAALLRPVQGPPSYIASAAQDGSQSAVALHVVSSRWRIVAGRWSRGRGGIRGCGKVT